MRSILSVCGADHPALRDPASPTKRWAGRTDGQGEATERTAVTTTDSASPTLTPHTLADIPGKSSWPASRPAASHLPTMEAQMTPSADTLSRPGPGRPRYHSLVWEKVADLEDEAKVFTPRY